MSVLTQEDQRRALILARGGARPGHVWIPSPGRVDRCAKCPDGSPFRTDLASHLYVIQEEF